MHLLSLLPILSLVSAYRGRGRFDVFLRDVIERGLSLDEVMEDPDLFVGPMSSRQQSNDRLDDSTERGQDRQGMTFQRLIDETRTNGQNDRNTERPDERASSRRGSGRPAAASREGLSMNPRDSSSDGTIFERASRHRNNATETRRHHRRRNINMDRVEQDLGGEPRTHWSCCTLGALAGDKGFWCDVSYYETSMQERNANRFNPRMRNYDNYFRNTAPTRAGYEIMDEFNRCVHSDPTNEFQRCCNRYVNEYNDRKSRWRDFRAALSMS